MLTPKRKSQAVDYTTYDKYTPGEHKLELIKGEFLSEEEKINLTLLCLYNMGLGKFVEFLPTESRRELQELLNDNIETVYYEMLENVHVIINRKNEDQINLWKGESYTKNEIEEAGLNLNFFLEKGLCRKDDF